MIGKLPSAREAALTSAEEYVLREVTERPRHYQILGCSSAVERLEWKGRVKVGPDLYVRTIEQHEAVYGKGGK